MISPVAASITAHSAGAARTSDDQAVRRVSEGGGTISGVDGA
jgi:hypothetical protein